MADPRSEALVEKLRLIADGDMDYALYPDEAAVLIVALGTTWGERPENDPTREDFRTDVEAWMAFYAPEPLKTKLRTVLDHKDAERERLRMALQEARPYVFNRTQEEDWRGETARDVLARVDVALGTITIPEDGEYEVELGSPELCPHGLYDWMCRTCNPRKKEEGDGQA